MNLWSSRVIVALALIVAFASSGVQPARADNAAFTRNILIGAALAAVGIIIGRNVAHKRHLANTIVGYTTDGGTVYADGRVVYSNGFSYYPNDRGQQIACRNYSCAIYAGSNPVYNGYYQYNGTAFVPPPAPAPAVVVQPPPPPPASVVVAPPAAYPPAAYPPAPVYPPAPPAYAPPASYYQPAATYGYGYGYPGYGCCGSYNAYVAAYNAYLQAYYQYYNSYYSRGAYSHDGYMHYSAPGAYCCAPGSNPYSYPYAY